jgi:hypothetical protein
MGAWPVLRHRCDRFAYGMQGQCDTGCEFLCELGAGRCSLRPRRDRGRFFRSVLR